MNHVSDEKLIANHCAGQSGAIDLLLQRYQDRVFQFVLWKTGASTTDAEDLAQEVFLQVFRSAGSFHGKSQFRTWLYSVAGHVCHRWIRTRSRRRKHEAEGCSSEQAIASLQVADKKKGLLEQMEIDERADAVRLAVQKLEPRHRVVLLLRDWEEMSYIEMADVLDIPVGTVKSRVHHARLQLAKILKPVLSGEA